MQAGERQERTRAKHSEGRERPHFDGFQPPKPKWSRSRLSRRKRDRVLAACMQRCNQPDCGVGIIPNTGRR
jgi:hypothetical protein